MRTWILPLLPLIACTASAQLTNEQKLADLRQLSGIYAKQYGPYEWKRDVIGFDALDLQPWLDRALLTQSDIDFMDLCVEYVASLNDAHDVVSFPTNFNAQLGFSTDLYDGKALVDSLSRTLLPQSRYPFVVGDELVSLDGIPVEEWLRRLAKYSIAANPRSTARNAAVRTTSRSQSRIPWAPRTGDSAEVVIRRASGDLETYTIPWTKTGVPIPYFGPLPSPAERAARQRKSLDDFLAFEDSLQPWQLPLAHLLNASIPQDGQAVLNSGALRPIFALPQGFQIRLGNSAATEAFTSGSYTSDGLRIGFIRIPSMSPGIGTTAALTQFENEILWMQTNTDGLIIDVMRNPGGSVLYVEQLCQRLTPYTFRSLGFEYRPLAADVVSFTSTLNSARAAGQPDWVIAGYEARLRDIESAYRENRGRTGPISLTQPWLDLPAWPSAYTKPIVVLVDDFSASGGDAFPATLQDNGRALLAGYRTMGAGGNVIDIAGATYSEASTRVTRSLMNRKHPTVTPDYPAAPYIENIGVRPDVELDYMTRDNLMNGGRPFVEAFTRIAVDHIRKSAN
ncbi:MAG: PDZ domain-containing protein [Candidatus Solibacter usitatus]|nr:PDZ domain-containing protein [Candidatus Solibacter usitatus]